MTPSSPRILVIGATSAIAQAVVRHWAAHTAPRLFLAARSPEHVRAVARDARVRGALEVYTGLFDATAAETWTPLVREAQSTLGGLDIVLIAHGSLPSQAACEHDPARAVQAVTINATSVIALSLEVARIFEVQGHGTLAAISSVAGDRPRRSLYVYGAAKQAVDGCLTGLRQRFMGTPVRILTVKPGRVVTPMTRHLPPSPLLASPARVAQDIVRAIVRGTSGTVYTPGFWRFIMLLVRALPERMVRSIE